MRKNYLMKSISIILMLLAMMFSCQPVSEDVDSGNSNSNNTSQGGNTGGDNTGNQNGGNTGGGNNEDDKPVNPQTLTLQQIINDTNAGEEIDLSKYKDVTDYSATVNKALTIKNGSLNNAKLIVTAENVKLEKLEKVSVSTSSRLTINNSKLSDLLIGANSETSRSGTLSTEMSLAMASITGCEIENVELIGFNSQLNITDVKTKINDIITSTKAKIILEAGSYEGMKDPTVTDDGELTRIDMTKEKELSVLSIYSNPKKAEYQIGEELDVTGLVVMGTYMASIEVFKSGGWKGEAVDSVTKWENEKDYTVTCEDFGTAGVKIVTITSNIDTKVKCNFYVYVKDSQNSEIKEPEITEIELRELGTPKTLYKVGEKLDLSCYQVVGIYNGLEMNLLYTSEPANGTTLTTVGETTVTLYYNGEKVAEFPITVENAFLVEFYDGIDNSKPLYTQKVTAGEKPSRPSDPVREDYTFTGWYYDEACSEPATYVFLERAEKDIQLYAQWLKDVPVTGVYSYKLNLGEFSNVWEPIFSIVLLTDEQVKASRECGKFNFSSKAYQLYSYKDMSIDNIGQPGNYAVYGTNPVDNEYQFYIGVATTVTDTTFEVFVDMSKIVKTELKAFSEMDGINEEEFVTESMPVNLTGYKPYFIALGIQAYDPDNYAMTGWDMDVMKMTAGATFPTDLQYTAPKILTLSDMEYVCSNFGNFPITFTDGIATAEITYSLDKAAWGQEALDGIQFGVCSDTSWNIKFTGARIYSFNTEATLTLGANEDNMVDSDILTDGTTYVLTIDANAGTVKITPKGADYDNVVTQEVKASELVDTITGLSAGVYKLVVKGTMDSSILANVKTAMQSKKDVEIALDLGGTTGLTEIPNFAFSDCNLTSIVIPEGVKSIGECALSCLSDSVTIPSTVTSIGYEAFGGEYGDLKAVYISDLVAWCGISIGGSVGSCGSPFFNGAKLYLDGELVTDLVIPDGVTSINSQVFYNYEYLTSVTIPDSVTSIGDWAFANCSNLESVSLGDGIKDMGMAVFSGCDKLLYNECDNGIYLGNADNLYLVLMQVKSLDITSCKIADTTKIIVDSVFQGCISLENIAIPDSVTTIGQQTFVNCPNLANITIGKGLSSIGLQAFAYNTKAIFNIDENNANYSSSTDGKMLLSKDQTTLLAYPSAEGDITIPESVTKIEIFVFSGYSSRLTSVTFAGTGTWYYTENSDYTDGTEIDVTTPTMNASYLASYDFEYYNKYWYKAE